MVMTFVSFLWSEAINMLSIGVKIPKIRFLSPKVEIKHSILKQLNIIKLNCFRNWALFIINISITELLKLVFIVLETIFKN